MRLNILRRIKLVPVILVSLLFLALYSSGDDDKKKINRPTGINIEDSYQLEINRIKLPLNNRGVIANVSVAGGPKGGFFDGKGFLFCSGFIMSGLNGGEIWTNGVGTAARIEDYLPGEVGGTNDQRALLYVVNSEDEPFGESWQEWKDAVDLGAYFYDGDGDGIYNPIDKNGDGIWNPDEDMPDLLGDETVWCVYNDAVPSEERRYDNVSPMGIEIRQTVWAYADSNHLGNVVFVRWSINNAGTVANVFDSVYFGAWADTDLGDFYDDLVGCDTTLNAGFIYNDGPDDDYGVNAPCFIIGLLQGPWGETGNPDDMAFNIKGTTLGTDTIYGAVNVPMTSFVSFIKSHPTQGTPLNEIQARYYHTGRNQNGDFINPCDWAFGDIRGGVDCSTIDAKYMYSGDPVTSFGWINIAPLDQRQMSNTGPFILEKDKPVDIIVAYVVGRGTSALLSISAAKQISRTAHFDFKNNFSYPTSPPQVTTAVKTTDNSIGLIWETSDHLAYREIGSGYDIMFESFEVYMHEINSLAEEINGRQNTIPIASYDVANDIKVILLEDSVSLQRNFIYTGGIQLDSSTYSDPGKGRISLTITTDPFTGSPLIKGRPYFISIVPTSYNREKLIKLDALGNYLVPGTAVIGRLTGSSVILSDGVSPFGIVLGKDTYTPFPSGVEITDHPRGSSDAIVNYDVKDRSQVTNDEYEVNFFLDSLQELYELYYSVTDLTTSEILLDSSKQYDGGIINDMVGGAVVNVEWVIPGITTTGDYYRGTGTPWFDNDTIPGKVGTWYMGRDVVDPLGFPSAIHSSNKSRITRASDMKNVELRFGETGKAYRYLKTGFNYNYAADSGFVDVPFQAWAIDKNSGTEYQLAVGYTESALVTDTLGNPDGKYDPGTDVFGSKEYIIIFNSPYDPEGDAYAYTGNSTRWANLGDGFNLNAGDPRFNDSLKVVAKSPYFDAIYVAGIQRAVGRETAEMTGIYRIGIFSLLTPEDRYRFKVNLDITAVTERDLFNKINIFPNPLFANNTVTAYTGESGQYVTFSYLPEEVTIKIYTLSGHLIRSLEKNDESPYMKWDLENEYGRRVGSGMYLAIVSNLRLGAKVLKFAIIQPRN